MIKLLFLFIFISVQLFSFSQSGIVKGRVFNGINNESISFAKIKVIGLPKGAISDDDGLFEISGLAPGVYSFKATVSGFKESIINEISVTNARTSTLDFSMQEIIVEQEEIVIKSNPFRKRDESPVSLKTLNSTEIERLPGANRDVSKVLQALPGVASRASFRNDIIIRGGSPGENKFYLDGIEVPNINHFATQGSSGGPVGLLNVNFIKSVDFYSGAFPANRANGLSSVISFKQKDGNPDAFITNFALGSSDAALTFDGPIRDKLDFIFSARRSYLQFLFAALKLPFLPTYNDFQFKLNYKPNNKNKITFIGLGALDDFALNTSVNENITDSNTIDYNNYILGNIPVNDQWNYTFGINWTHFSKSSYQNIVVSRNMLKNIATRYQDNIQSEANKLLDYSSTEAENKLRFEHTYNNNGWRFNVGFGYEYVKYNNSTFNKITVQGFPVTIDYSSDLFLSKGSLFSQLNKSFLNDKINLSIGLRTDINNYSSQMMNPLSQLSPMFSFSYAFSKSFSFNGNIARYHQLPAYTILGFRDFQGELINLNNDLKYIQSDQFVAGFEYITDISSRITVETFYKSYSNYPFSLNDSICLANLGSDFGVVGNEEVVSNSEGRAYGFEFLYQQKLIKGFYGILAYTYVNSEFLDKNNEYVPSAWDSKHSVSLTGGKRFKKGWELGFRWLFSGGVPYTPVDVQISSIQSVWDINGRALPNYNLLNTERESNFHSLNVRLDKKFYLDKFSMNFYIDIQNIYAYKTTQAPILLLETDGNGNPITDPNNSNNYSTKFIDNSTGIVQPTIGIVLEFAVKKKAIFN